MLKKALFVLKNANFVLKIYPFLYFQGYAKYPQSTPFFAFMSTDAYHSARRVGLPGPVATYWPPPPPTRPKPTQYYAFKHMVTRCDIHSPLGHTHVASPPPPPPPPPPPKTTHYKCMYTEILWCILSDDFLDFLDFHTSIIHHYANIGKRGVLQQQYSQHTILPSHHLRWVVDMPMIMQ